jgi:hypothetical protein
MIEPRGPWGRRLPDLPARQPEAQVDPVKGWPLWVQRRNTNVSCRVHGVVYNAYQFTKRGQCTLYQRLNKFRQGFLYTSIRSYFMDPIHQ